MQRARERIFSRHTCFLTVAQLANQSMKWAHLSDCQRTRCDSVQTLCSLTPVVWQASLSWIARILHKYTSKLCNKGSCRNIKKWASGSVCHQVNVSLWSYSWSNRLMTFATYSLTVWKWQTCFLLPLPEIWDPLSQKWPRTVSDKSIPITIIIINLTTLTKAAVFQNTFTTATAVTGGIRLFCLVPSFHPSHSWEPYMWELLPIWHNCSLAWTG